MKTWTKTAVANGLAIAALGLGLGACGGSSGPSESAFKAGYQPVRVEFKTLGRDIVASLNAANDHKLSNAVFAARFNSYAQRAATGLAQLKALTPPTKIQRDYQAEVTGLTAAEADLRALAAAVAANNSPASRAALARMLGDFKAIGPHSTAIRKNLNLPPA